MKKFTITFRLLALAAIAFVGLSQPVRACTDYHPPTVTVTVHYDTVNFTDIAIVVSNLKLFGGTGNEWCSCAVTNYTNLFSNLQYVAFVDSGTTNPVPGFGTWTPNAAADNAWESVLATGNWNGFLSDVNNNGLNAGAPVELIIRAALPLGYTYVVLDSNVYATTIGSDEWSNTNQNLANTHQSITSFFNANVSFIPEYANSTFFSDLDNSILLALEGQMKPSLLEVGPIPATDHLFVRLPDANLMLRSVQVFNSAGQRMGDIPVNTFNSGEARLDLSSYPDGVYFLHIRSGKGVQTKKFVVM